MVCDTLLYKSLNGNVTYFVKSNTVSLFPTGDKSRVSVIDGSVGDRSSAKMRFPPLYTVPIRFEN